MVDDYEAGVFAWGNARPWDDKPRLSNKDKFDWADMRSNGIGDVLVQPILRKKPCFGRPECFFRHGHKHHDPMMLKGRMQRPLTRCGRCPVYDACKTLSAERVYSDDGMALALAAFGRDCAVRHGSKLTYTGETGWLWTAFKKAVATRGPFFNVNDARVHQMEIEKAEITRQKMLRSKKTEREAQRRSKLANHRKPSISFQRNARRQSDRYRKILINAAGGANLPRCLSKIRPGDAAKTATLTANAWLTDTIRGAMGYVRKPGTIARVMVNQGLNEGLSYAVLKARVGKDLRRADEMIALGHWPTFDPDADLKGMKIDELEDSGYELDWDPETDEFSELTDRLGIAGSAHSLDPPTTIGAPPTSPLPTTNP
jgi:hypothetical protein